MTELLALEGVTKAWNGVPVLSEASLALAPGELAWLGGDNGTGKTTLLRIAAGVIRPSAGEIRVGGAAVRGHDPAVMSQIGYLPAGSGGLYARLSVWENVRLAASLSLIPRSALRDRIGAALARVGIEELAARRCDRLSQGQRQRVRLAATLVHRPPILLLDEPGTSLDEDGFATVQRLARETADAGGCVLWCAPGPEGSALDADVRLTIERGIVVGA